MKPRKPLPIKRRKVAAVEELKFNPDARQDYLSGFHKRKLQRISQAHEIAKRKEREERIIQRKQIREERKQDLERHVAEVDALLKKQHDDLNDDDGTFGKEADEEAAGLEEGSVPIDGMDEYVDEEKYTTVTVKEMADGKDWDASDDGEDETDATGAVVNADGKDAGGSDTTKKKVWTKEKPGKPKPKKKKKQKFRYEAKADRQKTRQKQKSKNSEQAKKRKEK